MSNEEEKYREDLRKAHAKIKRLEDDTEYHIAMMMAASDDMVQALHALGYHNTSPLVTVDMLSTKLLKIIEGIVASSEVPNE